MDINDLILGLMFPFIILSIEYGLIQPYYRKKEKVLPTKTTRDSSERGNWNNGIKNAVVNFKEVQDSYNWKGLSYKTNFVSIEKVDNRSDQVEIYVSVLQRYIFSFRRTAIDFFVLFVDREGKIEYFEKLPKDKYQASPQPPILLWLSIGVILIFSFWNILVPEKADAPEIKRTTGGVPITDLLEQGNFLTLNTPTNGTVSYKEANAYFIKFESNGTVTLQIHPVNNFSVYLEIYNNNFSQVLDKYIYEETNIPFAPESQSAYLLVIEPSSQEIRGGSYTFSVSTNNVEPNSVFAINGVPVDEIKDKAVPILVGSKINGTVGKGGISTYVFKSNNNEKLLINIQTLDGFACEIHLIDENNSRIRKEKINNFLTNIERIWLAPNVNTYYYLSIEAAAYGEGGSYTIEIVPSDTP